MLYAGSQVLPVAVGGCGLREEKPHKMLSAVETRCHAACLRHPLTRLKKEVLRWLYVVFRYENETNSKPASRI
jgi:hypothetical protein